MSSPRLELRPFPPPALPGFFGTTRLSATLSGPTCPSRFPVESLSPVGLPVLRSISSSIHAVATTPRSSPVASLVWSGELRPSLNLSQVGSRIALSRPAQRLLTLRPACSQVARGDLLHPEASVISLPPSPLRLLPAGATVAGWVSHPLKIGAFSRRTEKCGLVPSRTRT